MVSDTCVRLNPEYFTRILVSAFAGALPLPPGPVLWYHMAPSTDSRDIAVYSGMHMGVLPRGHKRWPIKILSFVDLTSV